MALQETLEKQGKWLFRYRGTLPLIFLFIGALLYIRKEIYPEFFILENTPYEVYYETFCLAVGFLGLFIRIYTVGHTPKNTSGRNVKDQVADTLNTSGVYSIVRHPLYLGNFFMWLGPALLTGHFWFIFSFCLFYWLYYERIMFTEEQFLRRKFGDSYLEWAEKVPAFIPKFGSFKKSDLTFSWKKILKKEKNGLAALLLIFFCFDLSGEMVDKGHHMNYIVMVMCIISVVMYCVLKYMKKYTKLLDEPGR